MTQSSFLQHHAPSPRRFGPEIPSRVRSAIDSWFRSQSVNLDEVRKAWFAHLGYRDVDDVASDIGDRWGEQAKERFYEEVQNDAFVDRWHVGNRRRLAASMVSHLHVPAPLYLDYIETAIDGFARGRVHAAAESMSDVIDPYGPAVSYINTLFAGRGIDYRIDDSGRAQWHGDQGVYESIIAPTLDALDDPRLLGCEAEFAAALSHLRAGAPKDLEDAIEEAGKAVESAMKILLEACGLPRPARQTAEPLWQALRDAGVIETQTKDSILATSRIRNEWGGHGQGGQVRTIPDGLPELAVRAAAAAIAFLASRMP